MVNHLWRKGLVASAFGMLALLSACTFTVQPDNGPNNGSNSNINEATPAPQEEETGSGEAMTIAEFVLPDNTLCLFSGTGTTVAFDGKRVNYTCEPVGATESTTQTLAILDDPVVVGPTEYFVDLATVAQTDGGFELHSSKVISFTAWEVVLADGRVCLHAGFGATMGFDGQRLNYTCDKGGSTADEVGLMGELVNQGEGVWLAQIDEIGSDTSGFTQLSSSQVAVSRISGAEVTLDGESGTSTTMDSNDLVGQTWQWVQTVYGDNSIIVASDPSRYNLYFDPSGQVAVTLDCNGGGGSYSVDGSSLLFGTIVSTRMACPEDSQATDFSKDLAEVYSYAVEDGHLYLSMKLDAGVMEFAPVEEDPGASSGEATAESTVESTEESIPEATEEPTAEATPEATEEATEETSEGANSTDSAGTTWQWEQSIYEEDMVVLANEPSRYQIIFNADGTVSALLDCNSGSGTFTLDGADLTFSPFASTRMACPQDSQANEFAEDLSAVISYAFADGNLHLTLSTNGVMEFSPVE